MADEVKNEEKKEEAIPSMDDFKEELEASLKQHARGKRADMAQWEKLQDDLDNKTDVEVEVNEAVKSGVTTTLEGIRAFIPASKLSLGYVDEKDLPEWVGKKLMVRVITADPDKNRLVLSAKDILREEADKKKAEKAAQVEVGQVLEGTVETLQNYGAFVDIGDGVTGLLHISQISNKRIKHPSVVLKEGQKVTVKVIDVKDGRISLSMKALEAGADDQDETKDRAERHDHRDRGERRSRDERDNYKNDFKGDGAVTTSLGSLMKKSGIKF